MAESEPLGEIVFRVFPGGVGETRAEIEGLSESDLLALIAQVSDLADSMIKMVKKEQAKGEFKIKPPEDRLGGLVL